jgi:hypothetical protein
MKAFYLITLTALVLISAVAANAVVVGETNPPLNRPEVITAGGAYGANVNIDTLTANGTVVLVSFGWST